MIPLNCQLTDCFLAVSMNHLSFERIDQLHAHGFVQANLPL